MSVKEWRQDDVDTYFVSSINTELSFICVQHLLKSFDVDESLSFMTFSSIAYCDSSTIEAWNCSDCGNTYTAGFSYTGDAYDSETKTYGYVGIQKLKGSVRVVVSFRGTANLANWLSDLEATKTAPYANVPNAKVHYGFYTVSQNLKGSIMESVAKAMKSAPVDEIYLTGHSLGAAISVLTSLSVKEAYPALPVHIYNFGQPRVGNQAFAQYFESMGIPAFRVVNFADIVPHVPPESMGFYHIATEVWLHNTTDANNCTVPENGKWASVSVDQERKDLGKVFSVYSVETCYSICDGSGEDGSCSDSISPFSLSIPDHLSYPPYNSPGESTSCTTSL